MTTASTAYREELLARAQSYQDRDEILPLDLFYALLNEGIDATEFTQTNTSQESYDD